MTLSRDISQWTGDITTCAIERATQARETGKGRGTLLVRYPWARSKIEMVELLSFHINKGGCDFTQHYIVKKRYKMWCNVSRQDKIVHHSILPSHMVNQRNYPMTRLLLKRDGVVMSP